MIVLPAEASDMPGRATLAVVLMAGVLEKALPPERRIGFWDDYSRYWAGGETEAARALKERLAQAALRRQDVIIHQCQKLSKNRPLQDNMESYLNTTNQVIVAAQAAALTVPVDALCFHYIHMMNNRLGILPLEEAYLAALAAQLHGESALRS